MTRDEVLRLLRGGPDGVTEWNRRQFGPTSEVIDLDGIDLKEANLDDVVFFRLDLHGANLSDARLRRADLRESDFRFADLSGCDLTRANLGGAKFEDARLNTTLLNWTLFQDTHLAGSDFSGARLGDTIFSSTDLSGVVGLEYTFHRRPSTVGSDTLILSQGKLPGSFLEECGLPPWDVLAARLHDPALTPPQYVDLQYAILDAWTKGRGMTTGCFISYSWDDAAFADKLRTRLRAEKINVWLDRHDMAAGSIQDQVWRAIQLHHVVILILSEHSIASDWVENELEMAREKEKAENRDVLCPVALDDSWKAKLGATTGLGAESRALWRTLGTKMVLDFSRWKTVAFDKAFAKLLKGLRVNY